MAEPAQPLTELPAIAHQGQRVITTELLARVYGVGVEHIQDNYRQNAERFLEGVHFYKLTGSDLRAFKNQPDHNRLVGLRAPHLLLWTDRGAARHAKLLSSEEAWVIFGRLEDSYFAATEQAEGRRDLPAARAATALREFRAFKAFGKLIGLDQNQAILRANRATFRACGVDLLASMESPLLEAPHQDSLMTVTELGMRLGGINARRTNSLLIAQGLQIAARDHRGDLHYEATTLGRPHSRMLDVDKVQGGAPVLQLRWLTSVIEPLKVALTAGGAA